MTNQPRLIAIEGVTGGAIAAAARTAADAYRNAAISLWDTSGLFAEVAVTEEVAGRPSARTLLLLYASDLAFRLRSEVLQPLSNGGTVVVSPYVETAIAFGRAAAIDTRWIADMFAFAPPATETLYVSHDVSSSSDRPGFVEFCARQIVAPTDDAATRALVKDTDRHLRALIRCHDRLGAYGDVAT